MLKKRIIPCLDIRNGRTVKGVNFVEIRDAGDPVELAIAYSQLGADELVFLDITATTEEQEILLPLVERIAAAINIPFTVGGGIRTVEDAAALIKAGADKVSINSAAVLNPGLITAIAERFGTQCVVVAMDVRPGGDIWEVMTHGGTKGAGLSALAWAKTVEGLGAGEILLTAMSSDGTKEGFATGITEQVCRAVNLPVIASGGAGCMEHFYELFHTTSANAGLAASIFHFNELSVPALKSYLRTNNIPVR